MVYFFSGTGDAMFAVCLEGRVWTGVVVCVRRKACDWRSGGDYHDSQQRAVKPAKAA